MMYEGFAVSEKGYQHILNHTVCQDSTQYLQDADCVVATVADGHGSKQYFRSDRGSRFAAEIACNKIREFLKSITFPFPDSKTKKSVVTQLIHSIITEWHIAVRNDLIKSPFTPNELERVPEKYQKTFQFFTEENYRPDTKGAFSRTESLRYYSNCGRVMQILRHRSAHRRWEMRCPIRGRDHGRADSMG